MNASDATDLDAAILAAAQSMIQVWPTLLDAYDGMIRQAVERGWDEPAARALVIAAVGGRIT